MAWLFLKNSISASLLKVSMTWKQARPKIVWVENKPNLIIENIRYVFLNSKQRQFFSLISYLSDETL